MKQKFILGYALSNFLIFIIPVIFSFFITLPEASMKTFLPARDKQEEPPSVTLSVMDSETKTVTEQRLEEYLIGVITAEMPASYEAEALKAQAVAARSYILSRQQGENPDHPEAAVCNSPSHCKGHLSLEAAKAKWGKAWEADYYPKIKAAVEATEGKYLTYDNQVIEAFFFALSNGETESSEDVWGTGLPYLKSTKSEEDISSPDFHSVAEFSLADFNQRLKNLDSAFNALDTVNINNITYTEGGRIKNIDINSNSFSGTQIRSAFGLNSADFTVKQEGDKIIFNVRGKGHGVGMSQYGANALAKKGYTYEEILKHYYKGVEIINK